MYDCALWFYWIQFMYLMVSIHIIECDAWRKRCRWLAVKRSCDNPGPGEGQRSCSSNLSLLAGLELLGTSVWCLLNLKYQDLLNTNYIFRCNFRIISIPVHQTSDKIAEIVLDSSWSHDALTTIVLYIQNCNRQVSYRVGVTSWLQCSRCDVRWKR